MKRFKAAVLDASLFRRSYIIVLLLCNVTLLLIPAVIPACWYLIMANHSIIHFYLHTYRTAVSTVFARTRPPRISAGSISRSVSARGQ